ncbi:UNVERIFIED_CONTAM: hypothetical protein K2H54_045529 [Gekko kuhli]
MQNQSQGHRCKAKCGSEFQNNSLQWMGNWANIQYVQRQRCFSFPVLCRKKHKAYSSSVATLEDCLILFVTNLSCFHDGTHKGGGGHFIVKFYQGCQFAS